MYFGQSPPWPGYPGGITPPAGRLRATRFINYGAGETCVRCMEGQITNGPDQVPSAKLHSENSQRYYLGRCLDQPLENAETSIVVVSHFA
jgi:hypothetical protein